MFEKLDVYQKAVDLADEITVLTERFPRSYGFLVDQFSRAALSIATNPAEGNGRFTYPDVVLTELAANARSAANAAVDQVASQRVFRRSS